MKKVKTKKVFNLNRAKIKISKIQTKNEKADFPYNLITNAKISESSKLVSMMTLKKVGAHNGYIHRS